MLIGALAFCAGFGPGQAVSPASAEPSLSTVTSPLPSVSVPVPTPSVPLPTVSVPVPPTVPTPTVPTVPTLPPSPPPAIGPAPGGAQLVPQTGGSQTLASPGTAVQRSQSTATRVRHATRGGGRLRSGSPDRRHAAAHRSGAAARRGELAASTTHRPSPQARAPASSRTSSSTAQHSHHGSSDPLGTLGKRLPLPIPVPDWSKPIIALLLLVAIWLGVRFRLAAARAKRLEQQDELLHHDVDTMQAALVPEVPSRPEGLAVSAAYRPADGPAAGGDFYDVFVPRPGEVAIVLGDVCGHGREAVRHAALTRYTLRAYLQAGLQPRATLELAGQALADPGGPYATVAVAVYHAQSGTLTYANAGHPPPITFGLQAHRQPTSCASPPIGWGVPTGRRQTRISLPAGAWVCFFSDGLTDARRAGELLGRECLDEILHSLVPPPAAAELLEQVRAEADTTPDDMAACVLAPEVAGKGVHVHVEELEADARALQGKHVPDFLEECGVPAAASAHALERAREIVAEFDRAVLAVHPAPTGATVTVTSPKPSTRTTALGNHREPASARLRPLPGT